MYFEWLEEEQLAHWMAGEHVVEAVLGDPDPSGTGSLSSSGNGASEHEADNEVCGRHAAIVPGGGGGLMIFWCL